MATRLGAGKYVFGENIPMGRYNLNVISGSGLLYIQTEEDGEWLEDFSISLGKGDTESYHGISLPKGKYFRVTGNVVFEISRATMINID